MTHQITISENDYLTFQLFEASTNPLKKQSRKRSYFLLIIISLFVVFFGYQNKNDFMFYYGIACTILTALFANAYIKWRHKKHYARHVKDVHKNSFSEQTDVEILDDLITTKDKTGSSNVYISEIAVINEIPDQYLIKLSTSPTLIIPKTNSALNEEILAMIKRHNITHVTQPDWKW